MFHCFPLLVLFLFNCSSNKSINKFLDYSFLVYCESKFVSSIDSVVFSDTFFLFWPIRGNSRAFVPFGSSVKMTENNLKLKVLIQTQLCVFFRSAFRFSREREIIHHQSPSIYNCMFMQWIPSDFGTIHRLCIFVSSVRIDIFGVCVCMSVCVFRFRFVPFRLCYRNTPDWRLQRHLQLNYRTLVSWGNLL